MTNGLLAANPAHKIKQPRARRGEARFLKPEGVTKFLTGAEGLRYLDALKLILLTGLRRGEAFALAREDVDRKRGEARVKGSLVRQSGALVIVDTMTEKSRRTIALEHSGPTALGSTLSRVCAPYP